MSRHPRIHGRPPQRRSQRGVTLIIALVMLVAIGLASAAVMRGSLSADTVANNARVQTLANQAAQLALRFCETQVETPQNQRVAGFVIQPVTAPHLWTVFANWEGGGAKALNVPASVIASTNSSFTPNKLPQCIAESSNDVAGVPTIIVTARGFSPDYAQADDGRQTAGSVVWLQSTLRTN